MSLSEKSSLATQYQVQLLELGDESPSEKKAILLFNIMDQVIPQLGVFSGVFKVARDELFDAVYSDTLTGTTITADQTIQQVPYFTLVHRVQRDRAETEQRLNESVRYLQESLFEKQKQFELAMEKIENIEKEKETILRQLGDMNSIIERKDATISSLETQLEDHKFQIKRMEMKHQEDNAIFQAKIVELQKENEILQNYKNAYDEMYKFFSVKKDAVVGRMAKRSVPANKKSQIVANLHTVGRLEEQLVMAVNSYIDDFETFLRSQDSKFVERENLLNEYEKKQLDLEVAEEANEQLYQFKANVAAMRNELELVRQHKEALQQELESFEQQMHSEEAHERIGLNKERSFLSEELMNDDLNGLDNENPFVPHEKTLSKYSARVYTSADNGKTFIELPGHEFCHSCGEKTLICPHHMTKKETLIKLPNHTTSIKIIRPQVNIKRNVFKSIVREQKHFRTASYTAKGLIKLPHVGLYREYSTHLDEANNPLLQPQNPSMTHKFDEILADYASRGELLRVVPRNLSKEKTYEVLMRFWSWVLIQDSIAPTGLNASLLDKLYLYFKEHFHMDDVELYAASDFFSAILLYAQDDRTMELFGHALTGNCDGSTFRYVALLADIVGSFQWNRVEDFGRFLSAFCVFASDDDLETNVLNYISFSENKISASLVWQYFILQVLRGKDLRFAEAEYQLSSFLGAESKSLTEDEFSQAAVSLIQIDNELLLRNCFLETERACQRSGAKEATLPMTSQLFAYLELLSIKKQAIASIKEVLPLRDQDTAYPLPISHQELFALGENRQRILSVQGSIRAPEKDSTTSSRNTRVPPT